MKRFPKITICPQCSHEFEPETKPRSATGNCSRCGHQLPNPWRWKRCPNCNEIERLYIAKYRARKKLNGYIDKKTQETKVGVVDLDISRDHVLPTRVYEDVVLTTLEKTLGKNENSYPRTLLSKEVEGLK